MSDFTYPDETIKQATKVGQTLAEFVDCDPDLILGKIVAPHFGWPFQYPDPERANGINEAYDWIHRAMVLGYIRARIVMAESDRVLDADIIG